MWVGGSVGWGVDRFVVVEVDNDDGITSGIDSVYQLVFSNYSFDSLNNEKPDGLLL